MYVDEGSASEILYEHSFNRLHLAKSEKPNASSHRTPHWFQRRNHMANGTNIATSKNRGCGTFNLYLDEICGSNITIFIEQDRRMARSKENPSSLVNGSQNVKISSSRRNTHVNSKIIPLECIMNRRRHVPRIQGDQIRRGRSESPRHRLMGKGRKEGSVFGRLGGQWKGSAKSKKKGEASGKDKAMEIRTEGPMIIELEIRGHFIHRMYVDEGSASEILYEHSFNRLHLAKSEKPNASSHRTPHWFQRRNHMANGTNIATSKNRGCGTFNLYLDEICGSNITISIEQDRRMARSKENPSSLVNGSQNVKIPSSRRNTHANSKIIPLECIMVVLALVHASKRLKRYFQAYPIVVIMDQPIKQPQDDSPAAPMEVEEELPDPWTLIILYRWLRSQANTYKP
nr:hypothetical protein [Tanacetum cinerariifolium]